MKKEDITLQLIKKCFVEYGYNLYVTSLYDLNIFGIRAETSVSDKFDDFIGVIYKDEVGFQCEVYPATTDPGKHWLLNPMNVKGTFIMSPGQHKRLWKLGKHKNYTALQQIGSVKGVRDNNKDSKLNFDLFNNSNNIITPTNIGINLHTTSFIKNIFSPVISANLSCIDFNKLISLANKQIEVMGINRFSYTLFTEKEVMTVKNKYRL